MAIELDLVRISAGERGEFRGRVVEIVEAVDVQPDVPQRKEHARTQVRGLGERFHLDLAELPEEG